MFASLYRRRAGVKHSTRTEEDVDTSIMNASTPSCDVNRGGDASTGRDVTRAKMDISNHIGDHGRQQRLARLRRYWFRALRSAADA